MTITTRIAPTNFMPLAIFYDRNHNPLNIPCEGPRAVQVTLNLATTDISQIFIIDFTQMFTSGYLTALQSVYIDLSGIDGVGADTFLYSNAIQTPIPARSFQTAGASGQSQYDCIMSPLTTNNPPQITYNFEGTGSGGIPAGSQVTLTFYNFMMPPLYHAHISPNGV